MYMFLALSAPPPQAMLMPPRPPVGGRSAVPSGEGGSGGSFFGLWRLFSGPGGALGAPRVVQERAQGGQKRPKNPKVNPDGSKSGAGEDTFRNQRNINFL